MRGWGSADWRSPTVDNALSVANLGACALYLHLAIGPVSGSVGVRRLAQTVVLALAVALIVLAYRFAMFLVTLYAS